MKKIIKILLVLIWMIIIFIFSSQTGIESQSVSDGIVNKLIITNSSNFELISFIIRKSAHFILYFILGILVYNCTNKSKDNMINCIIICIIYSLTDEMHQMFISDRAGEFRDIIIDSFGSIFGILFIYKLKRK